MASSSRLPGASVRAVDTSPGPPWRVTSGEPDPRTVERLLRSLTEWFGIESSLVEYVAAAVSR